MIDVEQLCVVIGRAVDDVFPRNNWHVGALAPSIHDEKWTVVVRTSPLVAPLFCVRSPRLIAGLFDLSAQVLGEAEKAELDGEGLRELAQLVNAISHAGVLS